MSEYLHATYDKRGLEMGVKPPSALECSAGFDTLYKGVTALFPILATPHCPSSLDDGEHQGAACGLDWSSESIVDKPRILRYVLDGGNYKPASWKLPARATSVSIGRLNLIADKPYMLRYVLDADKDASWKLPARAVSVWVRMIIGAGR